MNAFEHFDPYVSPMPGSADDSLCRAREALERTPIVTKKLDAQVTNEYSQGKVVEPPESPPMPRNLMFVLDSCSKVGEYLPGKPATPRCDEYPRGSVTEGEVDKPKLTASAQYGSTRPQTDRPGADEAGREPKPVRNVTDPANDEDYTAHLATALLCRKLSGRP